MEYKSGIRHVLDSICEAKVTGIDYNIVATLWIKIDLLQNIFQGVYTFKDIIYCMVKMDTNFYA